MRRLVRLLLEGLAIEGFLAACDLFVDGVGFLGVARLAVGVGDAAVKSEFHGAAKILGGIGFGLALVELFQVAWDSGGEFGEAAGVGLVAGHELAEHFEVFAIFAETAFVETAEGFGGFLFDENVGQGGDGIGDEVAFVAVGAGDAADFAFEGFDHLVLVEGGEEVLFADGGDVFEDIGMVVVIALHGGEELFPVLCAAVFGLGEGDFFFPNVDDERGGAARLFEEGEGGVPLLLVAGGAGEFEKQEDGDAGFVAIVLGAFEPHEA